MAGGLDASTFRRALALHAEALRAHRDELNSLNVFPVPDGDTGTNMLLTVESVETAMASTPHGTPLREVCEVVARASLMGARGNSGVILSQVLRALGERLDTTDESVGASAEILVAALDHAAAAAWRAVGKPTEGTILTVLRDAATAGRGVPNVGDVLDAALAAARASLARTTDMLPALREAGVVDAGAKGIVLLLASLRAALRGESVNEPLGPLGPIGRGQEQVKGRASAFGFEVQLLLEAPDEAMAPLRHALAGLGDALVVVGGGGLYNVHMHTNEPDRAVEAARAAGVTVDSSIVDLDGRVAECLAGRARGVRLGEQETAMVAVTDGAGLADAFGSLGAIVVPRGPGSVPTVEDLLAVIDAAPSDGVVIVPNHPDVGPAAARAAEESPKDVRVVRARSVPAGLAASTAFNAAAGLQENLRAADAAAALCHSGAATRVVREADSPVGPGRRGRWFALVEDEQIAMASNAPAAVRLVAAELARRAPNAEILTIVTGADAPLQEIEAVAAVGRSAFPDLKFELLPGGQSDHAYLIGLE